MAIKEGSKAPAFSLPSSEGREISLSDFEDQTVILYFYPKDDTPGCTQEACDFRDSFKKFQKQKAVILGISADSVAAHQKFSGKYKLPFPLLSDESKEIIKKYGVWKEKSMYGKKYMGIERTTVVIAPKGKVAKIFPKVKVTGHIDEVIKSLTPCD